MSKLMLPPDAGTDRRRETDGWLLMHAANPDSAALNYPAWLGQLTATLMQAQPPRVEGLDADETDVVVDLLDEATEVMAATGAAYFRPSNDGEQWMPQVLDGSNVAPVWRHRKLKAATVWSVVADPRSPDDESKALAIVEYWGERDGVALESPQVELWEGERPTARNRAGAQFEGKRQLDLMSLPESVDRLAVVAGAKAEASNPAARQLHAVTWKWVKGRPVPIFHRNEGFVRGLCRLTDQEQTDAEMARRRIAVDQQLVATNPTQLVGDSGNVVGTVPPGFALDSNVFLLNSQTGHGAQNLDKLQMPLEVIDFSDDLTQRERIERRENSLLEVCGIAPASIGRNVKGSNADSGKAKASDKAMTNGTVANPARRLSRALSAAFTQTAKLASSTAPDVTVTVVEGVKPSLLEAAELAGALSVSEAASTRTLVRTAQPGWTVEQVDAEVALLAAEGRGVLPAEDF